MHVQGGGDVTQGRLWGPVFLWPWQLVLSSVLAVISYIVCQCMSVSPMPESIGGQLHIQHLKVVRHLASLATAVLCYIVFYIIFLSLITKRN